MSNSNRIVFIIFLTSTFFSSIAQNLVTEIKGEGRELDDLKAFSRGYSIFIAYYDKAYVNDFKSPSAYKTLWILPDGTQVNLNLKTLGKKQFIGATKQNDSSFYYFLDDVKKKIQLKALVAEDTLKIHDLGFGFSGKLLSSYVENDFLFLLIAEKEELRLIKIKNLKVVNSTSFSILPLDLSKDKKKQFNFVDLTKINRPGQFTNLGKVIKTPNALFIVVDDPADFHNEQQTSFRTVVIKLDLVTGSAMTKYFFEKSRSDFRTTVFGDKVFHYADKKEPEITIYEYMTGKVLKKQLSPTLNLKDSLLLKAGKGDLSFFEKASNLKRFISVDSVDSNLIITVGNEFEHDPVSVVPIPIVSLISLAVFAGTAIAGEINEGKKSYIFYCLEGTMDTDFQKANPKYLPNQKINIYERIRKDEAKIKHRVYVSNTKRIFAIYNESGSNDLKVLKFER